MFAYCLNNPVAYIDTSGTAAYVCWGYDEQPNEDPWKEASSCGGGRFRNIYYSQQDYGTVADKFYTVRALRFLGKQIAHSVNILSDAYAQSYKMQQEAQRVEAELISTVAPRVRKAGVKGGANLVIGVLVETGFKTITPDEAPKLTLTGLVATFAAGYVGGAIMEIWNILEEVFL